MAVGDQRAILWPYSIEAPNNVLRIAERSDGTGGVVDATIAAGVYMARGAATGPSAGTDLCSALAAELDAAYAAIYTAGAGFVVEITADGRLSIENPNFDYVYLRFDHATTTLPPHLLGWPPGTGAVLLGDLATTVSPWQVYGRWHPGIPHVSDTREHEAHVWAQGRTTTWTPWYVLHSDVSDPAGRRYLEWEHIQQARVLRSAAADSVAAAVAGLTTGDMNAPFETLLRYVLDASAPYPSQVYVSDIAPSAGAVLSGRYHLVLDDDMVDEGGVSPSSEHRDETQSQYRVSLELVRSP